MANYSLAFDGSTGVADCGSPSGLNGASKASLSGWVYKSGSYLTCGFGATAGNGETGGNRFSLNWYSDNNLYVSSEYNNGAYGTCPLGGTGWHHIVAVFDGTQTGNAARLIVYLDGVAQTLTFPANPLAGALGTVLPSWTLGKDSSDRFCGGSVASVAVYGGQVLTSGNAAGLAAGTLDPLSLSPSGCWKLTEGTGATTADNSGNGNTGTLSGGVTWSNNIPPQLATSAANALFAFGGV